MQWSGLHSVFCLINLWCGVNLGIQKCTPRKRKKTCKGFMVSVADWQIIIHPLLGIELWP